MGAWGHGIWENDTALDVKDNFDVHLMKNSTVATAIENIVSDYTEEIERGHEDVILMIADIQINHNTTHGEVLKKAKEICVKKTDILDYSNPHERIKVLNIFYDKIINHLKENQVQGEFERYEVVASENYYDSMVGKLVFSTPKTVVLEFKLNKPLGGLQRVQFFKEQVSYTGKF